MPDLSDQIESAAETPKSVTIDGNSANARDLRELIEVDQYLAAKRAASTKRQGLSYRQIVPPGGA